mmetsp:Transcript_18083/g.45713  ORF Transcript_18083/g.45713 Transcript_18083/m.45713 type:complete len:425 (-) Transcript_18083:1037-2311(-)
MPQVQPMMMGQADSKGLYMRGYSQRGVEGDSYIFSEVPGVHPGLLADSSQPQVPVGPYGQVPMQSHDQVQGQAVRNSKGSITHLLNPVQPDSSKSAGMATTESIKKQKRALEGDIDTKFSADMGATPGGAGAGESFMYNMMPPPLGMDVNSLPVLGVPPFLMSSFSSSGNAQQLPGASPMGSHHHPAIAPHTHMMGPPMGGYMPQPFMAGPPPSVPSGNQGSGRGHSSRGRFGGRGGHSHRASGGNNAGDASFGVSDVSGGLGDDLNVGNNPQGMWNQPGKSVPYSGHVGSAGSGGVGGGNGGNRRGQGGGNYAYGYNSGRQQQMRGNGNNAGGGGGGHSQGNGGSSNPGRWNTQGTAKFQAIPLGGPGMPSPPGPGSAGSVGAPGPPSGGPHYANPGMAMNGQGSANAGQGMQYTQGPPPQGK